MKAPYRTTPVSLCVSAVLAAVLMCLLNGEHYGAQLESAWPSSRPLAEFMGKVSRCSRLPALHGLMRQSIDFCCQKLWRAEDGGKEEPSLPPASLAEVPSPPPLPEFLDFHERWLGRNGESVYDFCAYHLQWLGKPGALAGDFRGFHEQWLGGAEPRSLEFSGFHEQWLGWDEAEKLVDSCPVNCRVLLMGDSLMEDFGVYFYQHAKARRGLQMILLAKFSTGLCRPDYFNWFELFPQTLDDKTPHIVLFMIGANDGQPVWYSKGKVTQTKPAEAWKQAYGERAGALLADAEKRQILPLWVGMPVMGSKYASLLAQTEEATREECARRGVPYVDNRALLAGANGEYQSFIKNEAGKMVRVRQKDKEHMTPEGNRMLVRAAMLDFERVLRQHRLTHPELCAYPSQQGSLPKPSLDIVIPYQPYKK